MHMGHLMESCNIVSSESDSFSSVDGNWQGHTVVQIHFNLKPHYTYVSHADYSVQRFYIWHRAAAKSC